MDGFRFSCPQFLQSCNRSSFRFRSQLPSKNKLILQSLPHQRNKSNPLDWIYLLSGRIASWLFRNHHSFYLCYNYGSLCLHEYFVRKSTRNWLGFLNRQLHRRSFCLCLSWGFSTRNPKQWTCCWFRCPHPSLSSFCKSSNGLSSSRSLPHQKSAFSRQKGRTKSLLVFRDGSRSYCFCFRPSG